MAKDLTSSRLDRQNILNNEMAIEEIQNTTKIKTVFWNNKHYFTKVMVADYFQADVRTVERYLNSYAEELSANGHELLKGKIMDEFIEAYNTTFAADINVARKIRSISIFDLAHF